MFKLYFESNGQAHVATFIDKGSDTQESLPLQTLTVNTDSGNDIFNMDIPAKMISSTGVKDDIEVVISNISINDYEVEIEFVESKEQYSKLVDQKNQYLSIQVSDRKQIHVYNIEKGSNKYSYVNVKLKFLNYISLIGVHCVPQSSLYDVALDFGSEASQILIKCADDDSAAIPQKLFHNTLRHFWGSSVKGKRVYDQQDEDDHLFRSIFFKKEKGRMDKDFEIEIPQKKDGYFAFISRRTDILGERIPNIKISYLTGKEAEGGEKLRLHTGVILRFLHEALMEIGDVIAERLKDSTIPTAIRFTLLLPNVMPQNSITSLLTRLRKFSNSEAFLNYHKDRLNIVYIDIQSCSESDASFLERMNKIEMKPGERCLTIDIGKGTTDFSITQKLGAYKASSEFRSGFVGAGNALSYAIFDNCVQLLGGERKDQLIQKILDSETAMLYELDNIIEDFKHHWNEDDSNEKVEPIKNIDSVSVEVILDRIRSMRNIGDRTGSIKRMVETISQNIIERLPDLKINKIVISGRAFRFKLLRDILEKELKVKFRNVECYYNNDSAKSGCLIGASGSIRLCSSSAIVGIPIIIDASSVSANPKAFIKQVGDYITEKENLSAPKKKSGFTVDNISQTLKNSLNVLKDWIGNDDSEYTSNKSLDSRKDDVKLLMTRGKDFKQINSNSLISISGRYYVPIDRYLINDKDKPFSIYFDGDTFFLRHKYGSHPLIAATIQGTQNLCFESQFPYSMKDGIVLTANK